MKSHQYQTRSPFTEEFKKRGGKYLKWAEGIDEETLYCVLWFVGEIGARASGGEQFSPEKFSEHLFFLNERQHIALELLGRIYYGEKPPKAGIDGVRELIGDGLPERQWLQRKARKK